MAANGGGRPYIIDLESANGTMVNGIRYQQVDTLSYETKT
jgi:pSer/pThr/pTyr-binding forkhead associated (FHA) protein